MKRLRESTNFTATPYQIVSVLDDGTNIHMAVARVGDCWSFIWMHQDEETVQGPAFLFPATVQYKSFDGSFRSIQADFKRMNSHIKDFVSLDAGATWAAICGWFAVDYDQDKDKELPESFNIKAYREKAQDIMEV